MNKNVFAMDKKAVEEREVERLKHLFPLEDTYLARIWNSTYCGLLTSCILLRADGKNNLLIEMPKKNVYNVLNQYYKYWQNCSGGDAYG